MEVLREEPATMRFCDRGHGFNPCFNGSVERGRAAHGRLRHGLVFQSLF